MALFRKAEVTSAFLKMGVMGFAGSGKTYTATQTAIGLIKYAQERKLPYANKPVFFLDTEKGVDWVQPVIEGAGLELFTSKTRAFKNLVASVSEAEANGSILLVDSLTHFWTELTDAYMKSKNRTRLQFEDWAWLKKEWRRFTDSFINSNLHIIVCGRAGYEYDYFEDDAGKKQLEKTGIKMKAEGEMGYEPSLLVLMERHMDVATNKVWRTASVLKDRACLIDGKEFKNPGFKEFLPHVERLNLGGVELGVNSDTSADTIPADTHLSDMKSIRRQIVIDELEALLQEHGAGGTSNEAKNKRAELIKKHYRTTSRTEIERLMPLTELESNFDALHRELTGEPSRYGVRVAAVPPAEQKLDDEIPEHADEKAPTAVINPEPDDRDIIIRDFEAALAPFQGNTTRIAMVRKTWDGEFKGFDKLQMARIDAAVAKATRKETTLLRKQLEKSVELLRSEAAE